MTRETLRLHLRTRTQALHAELDAAIGPVNSPAAYGRYVRAIHAFRASAERPFTPYPALGEWQPTRLTPELERDLSDLKLRALTPVPLHMTNDISAYFGLLYVLEGSALGARFIRKQAAALVFTESHGARHLARQAASLDNWQGFLTVLDNTPDIDWQDAAAGAIAAFSCAREAVVRADHDQA